jgi:hypothetical protein
MIKKSNDTIFFFDIQILFCNVRLKFFFFFTFSYLVSVIISFFIINLVYLFYFINITFFMIIFKLIGKK